MDKFLVSVFLLTALTLCTAQQDENYVVLVSLDGFRSDYIEKHDAKNLKKLADNGVRVKRMIPSNPTKTFPNHYTLVTGLYPDNHGLINNYFYDPRLKKEYALKDRTSVEDGRFYGGEPIWITAKKAGIRTASFFWIGTEAKVNGIQPDIWKKYDQSIGFEQRVDSVISWLNLPKAKRPRLVMLYFHEPDGAGHTFGPESMQTKAAVRHVDQLIGDLYNKMMNLPIANQLNLIVVADHGMRKISKDKRIVMSDHIKKEWLAGIYGNNPVYTLKANPGKIDSVYRKLKSIPNLNVFKREKAPKRFNIATHIRTNDMIAIPEPGYSLFESHDKISNYNGAHGYLNTDRQMDAVFLAIGNRFKKGYSKNRIKNIDVYNLLANILNITPARNDGNFNRVKSLLKK